MDKLMQKVQKLLDEAGITINGNNNYDMQVHDDRLFQRVLSDGSLGLGEAFMEGWWDCKELDEFFCRVTNAKLETRVQSIRDIATVFWVSLVNLQKPSRAFTIGKHHYDIGDDLYEIMLDKRLIYSCGYWKESLTLDKAQENKLDLIFRKLGLTKGMHVLDIGCGWGGALKYAAEKYGVTGTGITVSHNQFRRAQKECAGLPIEIILEDYRKLNGQYDRVWSIGMLEHVGVKNYRIFMKITNQCLKPDGLFLLHTIGGNRSVSRTDPWIGKYIFPNSMIPSIRQLGLAWEDLFVMEDWHNFGSDYDKTLMGWYKNICAHQDYILKKYGSKFIRMWQYYLLCSAGAFRSRKLNLWQIVLSPNGVPGGYQSVR